mmetsp:Transcript_127559/g.254867  ORF Transcript_127559/g.254867 Transcript_127559/m.254867 type:complete len:343 (+) Transcript_127559:85-1113(+)|eukprot:CAMPEP_0172674342 /NCGR_PEP_ID=MMETSP1074-20121228/12684_1 /TAXON_ID=2916 /ORGANISM="Ceratium fusus, Strain PA161109" /LENGTH=342 /DNA_ID=CAMNT_0013491741 /DNA_START=86 /DNA_END=1114 /DNA_ORIENTATION=+
MALAKMGAELERKYGHLDADRRSNPPVQRNKSLEESEDGTRTRVGKKFEDQTDMQLEVPLLRTKSDQPNTVRCSSSSRDTMLPSSCQLTSQLTAEDWEDHFAAWPLEPQPASSELASDPHFPSPRTELQLPTPKKAGLRISGLSALPEGGYFASSSPPSLASLDGSVSPRCASPLASPHATPVAECHRSSFGSSFASDFSQGSTTPSAASQFWLQRTLIPSSRPWPLSACQSPQSTSNEHKHGQPLFFRRESGPEPVLSDAIRLQQVSPCASPREWTREQSMLTPGRRNPEPVVNGMVDLRRGNKEQTPVLGSMVPLHRVNESPYSPNTKLWWSPEAGYLPK